MLRPLVNCDSISDILGSAEGTARYVGGGTKGSSFFVSFPLFWSIGRGRAVAVAVDCYDHLLRFKFNLFFLFLFGCLWLMAFLALVELASGRLWMKSKYSMAPPLRRLWLHLHSRKPFECLDSIIYRVCFSNTKKLRTSFSAAEGGGLI